LRLDTFGDCLSPTFRHPGAEMLIDGDSWHIPTRSADPLLHATLKALAAQLGVVRRSCCADGGSRPFIENAGVPRGEMPASCRP
jgi:hypothetical protein